MVSERSVNLEEDVLKRIPDDRLPELRDVFKVDWPSHVHIFNFIDTAIKMNQKDKQYVNYITLYAPEGDWSDGTIVGLVQMRCYDVVVYSLDKTLRRLREALRITNLINWERKMMFPTVRIEFKEMLKDAKKERTSPFLTEGPSWIWWLPKEKALQYEWRIPPEYFLDSLKTSDADTMNADWPHRSPGSEKYIATLIEVNGGIGLYSVETKELCAWILKSYLGALGILQVAPKFKRKGLGSLIAKIFSKMLAEEGLDSIGCVVLDNVISQRMFEKLGFEKKIAVTWLVDIDCV